MLDNVASANRVGNESSIIFSDTRCNYFSFFQDYLDILTRFFPSRRSTRAFLSSLRSWALGHDDAIRGEDLKAKVRVIS